MDYNEFCKTSGWDVSREAYDSIIEPLYLNGPDGIIGVDVSEFCQWLKDNDFTLGQLRQIAAIVEVCNNSTTKADVLQQQLRDKDTELMISKENEDCLQRRLNIIYRVMDEDIVKRMVDEIPTDDIVDLYARLKVGQ